MIKAIIIIGVVGFLWLANASVIYVLPCHEKAIRNYDDGRSPIPEIIKATQQRCGMHEDAHVHVIRWKILEYRNRTTVGLLVTDTLGGILAIVQGKVPFLG